MVVACVRHNQGLVIFIEFPTSEAGEVWILDLLLLNSFAKLCDFRVDIPFPRKDVTAAVSRPLCE